MGVRYSVPKLVGRWTLPVDGWIATDDKTVTWAAVSRDGRDGSGQADENKNGQHLIHFIVDDESHYFVTARGLSSKLSRTKLL